jgi:hypothetical protein
MGLMLSGFPLLLRLKGLLFFAYFRQGYRSDTKSSKVSGPAFGAYPNGFGINLQTLLPRKFNNPGFSGLPVIRKSTRPIDPFFGVGRFGRFICCRNQFIGGKAPLAWAMN